ncbi:MAG TPA: hypothetical protein VNE40_01815 [Candidatus Dormibacteraeota bacterium]|nr:hypothetical protein [Candidatus Dormibacteraeota bacterium]
MVFILTILVVFILLCLNEIWWRTKRPKNELSRKFIHLTVGSFVAFWPFFLTWNEIRWLSLIFLIAVAISRYFRLFKAIHSVARPTWGEIFFAAAVGLLTLVTHDRGIYLVAILEMSLADGLAAVIGTQLGKTNRYKVFGHTKSLAGSVTFMAISYIILLTYSVTGAGLGIVTCLVIAFLATSIENVAVLGLDNLFVPLVVAFMLKP